MTNDKFISDSFPRGDVVFIDRARFRVDGLIHQGSDSRILSAHPIEGGGDSAFVIKEFSCRRGDDLWDDCLREIEAGLRLRRCRNILPLLGHSVRTDGVGNCDVFLLFERAECLDGQSLSPDEVLNMCRDILSALRYMKRRGLVHGDVKPANIYRRRKKFLLGDLGSVIISGQPARCVSRGYCAPEALRGEGCDFRSDLYALGITCYRLLSGGRLPFCPIPCAEMTGTQVHAAIDRRLAGEPVPPIPGLPEEINSALLRMCEFSPDRRMLPKGFFS